MARRTRKSKTPEELLESPGETATFSGEEFMFAFQVGNAAGSYRTPMESPTRSEFAIEGDGEIQHFHLTDCFENRFALAVKQHFGSDKSRFVSFMQRWLALIPILDLEECQRFIRTLPEERAKLIHSSVFEVAGTQPLDESGKFDAEPFLARVSELFAIDPN